MDSFYEWVGGKESLNNLSEKAKFTLWSEWLAEKSDKTFKLLKNTNSESAMPYASLS